MTEADKLAEALRRIGHTGVHGEEALSGRECRRLARQALREYERTSGGMAALEKAAA